MVMVSAEMKESKNLIALGPSILVDFHFFHLNVDVILNSQYLHVFILYLDDSISMHSNSIAMKWYVK